MEKLSLLEDDKDGRIFCMGLALLEGAGEGTEVTVMVNGFCDRL